jgi:threonine/homoserine/homoserine lactone efflux protein
VFVLVVAGPTDASDEGSPATWVAILELVLGLLLLLMAVKQWRDRPAEGEEVEMPKWMSAIDEFEPPMALGAGAVLSGLNPKNLLLAVAAGAAIAQTGISGTQQAIAYAVFAVIATIGVAAPVVIYFFMGDRAPQLLDNMKGWMGRHNAVIMSVLLLVLGVKLLGSGIADL